jgi:hypothetical protein
MEEGEKKVKTESRVTMNNERESGTSRQAQQQKWRKDGKKKQETNDRRGEKLGSEGGLE